MSRGVSGTVVVATLLALARAGAAETLVGDGKTSKAIQLVLDGNRHLRAAPAELTVLASAGQAGPVRRIGASVDLALDVTPPRVATVTPLVLVVFARGHEVGRQTLEVSPVPVEEGEAVSGGPLDLRAPQRLVLGRPSLGRVSVRKAAGPRPRLSVSAGRLSFEGEDGGRLRWRYTPPDDGRARVVILTAVSDDGAAIDWLAIQLWGVLPVEIRARPEELVSARVAGSEWGPVRADAAGRARLTTLLPAGAPSGTAITVDRLGNRSESPLELHAPPLEPAFAVCPDGERMLLFLVDAEGRPRAGEALDAETSLGRLIEPFSPSPGVYELRLAWPPGAPAIAAATVTATVRGDPTARAACLINPGHEPPTALRLSVGRARFVAGEGPVDVLVELRVSGRGTPLAVTPVLSADLGRLTEARPLGGGRYSARWTLPPVVGAHTRATLRARALNLDGTATVELAPGRPTRFAVTPPPRLRANGWSRSRLQIALLDAAGNPTSAELTARATGKLRPLGRQSDGSYAFDYTAPRSRLEADTLTLHDASGLDDTARLPLQPERRFVRLGAKVGYLTSFGVINAPLVLIEAGARLPFLGDNFVLSVEVGFCPTLRWQQSLDVNETVAISILGAPILAHLTYQIPIGRAAIYFGVGGGVMLHRTTVSSPTSGTIVDETPAPILAGVAGVDAALGRGRLLLETGYWWAPASGDGTTGNLGGLSFIAGYRLEL